MNRDQQIVGGVQWDVSSVGSAGSDLGREIPPMQGVGLPAEAGMFMSEEFRRTVHAWRGGELLVQSAVSRQEVEDLARDAGNAL